MYRRGGHNNLQNWKERFVQQMKIHKPQDNWTLDVAEALDISPVGWYQYGQKHLFARFECSGCPRRWESAQTVILFHFRFEKSWSRSQGQVKMWMFGQKCHRCTAARYEEPIFNERALKTILYNLSLKILEKSYGEPKRSCRRCYVEAILEGPHDKHNCEAREHGMCVETRTSRPTVTPSSLAPSIDWEEDFMRPVSLTQSSGWEEFQRIVPFLFAILVISFLLFCTFCFQKK